MTLLLATRGTNASSLRFCFLSRSCAVEELPLRVSKAGPEEDSGLYSQEHRRVASAGLLGADLEGGNRREEERGQFNSCAPAVSPAHRGPASLVDRAGQLVHKWSSCGDLRIKERSHRRYRLRKVCLPSGRIDCES